MPIEATIQEDVDTNTSTDLDRNSAVEVFLKKWEVADEDQPTDTDEGDTDANADDETGKGKSENDENEDTTAEDEEEGDDSVEEKPTEQEVLADDKHVIKYNLDGKEYSASVKDLKRLAGQEASLTRKSQEIAAKRKEVDNNGATYVAGLAKLVQVAEEDYRPYANIDFLAASREMEPEEFDALRQDATAKYERFKFFNEELGGVMQTLEQQNAERLKAQAVETVKILSDPDGGIEGWSPDLYKELRTYAIGTGLEETIVDRFVDPVVFKILHKAWSYDKAKNVATKKKAKAPKKVLKSDESGGDFSQDKHKKAMSNLRQSGKREDAQAALLAKWGVEPE